MSHYFVEQLSCTASIDRAYREVVSKSQTVELCRIKKAFVVVNLVDHGDYLLLNLPMHCCHGLIKLMDTRFNIKASRVNH